MSIATGGTTGSFSQLTKFKGGFVGRLFGIAAVALVVVLGVFVAAAYWRVEMHLVLAALVTILLIALPISALMFAFARRNPELAMLEGKEVIQFKQLVIAAKSGTIINDDPTTLTLDQSMPVLDAQASADATMPDEPTTPKKALPGKGTHG